MHDFLAFTQKLHRVLWIGRSVLQSLLHSGLGHNHDWHKVIVHVCFARFMLHNPHDKAVPRDAMQSAVTVCACKSSGSY